MERGTPGAARLARCLACGAKVKMDGAEAGRCAVGTCPMCALPLVSAAEFPGFAPFVAPAIDREAAWKVLAAERRFPAEPGAARIVDSRLLLAPFWIRALPSAEAPRSAADLRPIGLPPMSPDLPTPRGLQAARRMASGDAMGRLPEGVTILAAAAVAITRGPDGGDPAPSLEALSKDPAGAPWRLACYPVWAFHYALYEKECHHVVDAAGGDAVGPAHGVNWVRAAAFGAAALGVTWLATQTILGPFAALPAWAAGAAVIHYAIARDRRI